MAKSLHRFNSLLLCCTASAFFASTSQADSQRDIIDHIFGAGNLGAVGGHGGLTVGVSPEGDLAVLSWPSPGLRDHLAYFTSNDIDARSQPLNGAHEGMGSFLGLRLTLEGEPQPVLTWLRDASWTASQGYSAPLAPVPLTTFVNAELELMATVTDIVSPDVDALTRWVRLEVGDSSSVVSAELVVYGNFAPSVSQIEQLPIGDWALDPVGDFASVWDDDSQSALSFHPADRAAFVDIVSLIGLNADVDFGVFETLMRSESPSSDQVAATVAAIDEGFVPGVAALLSTEPRPVEFQVGSDATPLCALVSDVLDNIVRLPEVYPDVQIPLDAQTADALRCIDPLDRLRTEHEWRWQPQDALADLQDGSLSGSPVAAGRSNIALIAPMEREAGGFSATAVFAFGHTVAQAREALNRAEQQEPSERLSASEMAAEAALGEAALPDPALGERVVEIARRALVNIYVARDRENGGIIASVSRQPPYYLDWPRDGAFFSAALDVAGLTGWATQRLLWYAKLQRRTFTKGLSVFTPFVPTDPDSGEEFFPRYAWEMNYYTDGKIGGPIRFEIDNSALHVWSIALHAAHLTGEERKDFVDVIWPNTADALDTLARWRDASTGLPAPANEDDHLELTSELHGAVTVLAALEAGARLAVIADEDALGRGYLERADELRKAIDEYYFDQDAGLFRAKRDGEAGGQRGSTAWLAWPTRYLETDDPVLEAQLLADMNIVDTILAGAPGGGQYQSKNILSAALYGAEEGAQARARLALRALAEVATEGTNHFGESYLPIGEGEDLQWSNRVGAPHVWSGALFYLAAMALTNPADFDKDQSELAQPAAEGGCGCSSAGAGSSATLLLIILGLLGTSRQRQRSQPGSRGPLGS